MKSEFTPIALFCYSRLEHLTKTVEALLENPEAKCSDLVVFSDGPKGTETVEAVDRVRGFCNSIHGFRSVTVVARETNFGLSRSIISGVTEVLSRNGRVIVIEDDIVVSTGFLRYMNWGLEAFESNPRVASIHGYSVPSASCLKNPFWLRGADCWGWGTWSRAWEIFEPDGTRLLGELESKKLTSEFDFDGSYPFTSMLRSQIEGKNDSWAIRWYASAFLAEMYTLYPGRSLVRNIGFDGSGTHGEVIKEQQEDLLMIPSLQAGEPRFDRVAHRTYRRWFRRIEGLDLTGRLGWVWRNVNSILQRIGRKLRRA